MQPSLYRFSTLSHAAKCEVFKQSLVNDLTQTNKEREVKMGATNSPIDLPIAICDEVDEIAEVKKPLVERTYLAIMFTIMTISFNDFLKTLNTV